MRFSKKLIAAKESGVALAEEEAAQYSAMLHREGELDEDELDNVTGGWGSNVPDGVSVDSADPLCPSCSGELRFETNVQGDGMVRSFCTDDDGIYDIFSCLSCGTKYRRHWKGDSWTKD